MVLEQMHRRPELRSLTLVKLSLGPGCLLSLVSFVKQHKSLKQLQMADCQFVQGESESMCTAEDFLEKLGEE